MELVIAEFGKPLNISGPFEKRGEYYRFQVTPIIYHPAVECYTGKALARSLEELVEELHNPRLAFQCPMNIDASLDYAKFPEIFKKVNEKRCNILEDENDCSICFEPVESLAEVRFTCFNHHWVCETCFSQIGLSCPLCRRRRSH